MKKYFFMAVIAVTLMSQVAEAGLFARLRARRQSGQPTAAAPAAGTATPAQATPAPAPTTPAPATPPAK